MASRRVAKGGVSRVSTVFVASGVVLFAIGVVTSVVVAKGTEPMIGAALAAMAATVGITVGVACSLTLRERAPSELRVVLIVASLYCVVEEARRVSFWLSMLGRDDVSWQPYQLPDLPTGLHGSLVGLVVVMLVVFAITRHDRAVVTLDASAPTHWLGRHASRIFAALSALAAAGYTGYYFAAPMELQGGALEARSLVVDGCVLIALCFQWFGSVLRRLEAAPAAIPPAHQVRSAPG